MSLLNQIVAGILGRNPRVYGWPVLAIGLNPEGKGQPVAVDASGKVKLNGNITVPNGQFIVPEQAWINGASQLLAGLASGIGLYSLGATDFFADGGDAIANLISMMQARNTSLQYTFTDNPCTETQALLNQLDGVPVTNSTINIYGGSWPAPVPVQVHVDEIIKLDFTTVDCAAIIAGGYPVSLQLNGAPGGLGEIAFDPDISFVGSGGTTIGILDSPTAGQIANFVATYNTFGVDNQPVDNMDGTVTMTDSNESNYPYSPPTDTGTGITYTELQAGVAYIQNATVADLLYNGNTVNTN